MNRLNDYFMLPQYIQGIGNVYPIKISDYELFKKLAGKYFLQGRKWLMNIVKMPKETEILDFFVINAKRMEFLSSVIVGQPPSNEKDSAIVEKIKEELLIYNSNELIRYSINEIEQIFTMVLREPVSFKSELIDGVEDYYFEISNDDNKKINKYNFEKFRSIVMKQNLLFEPMTSPSKIGNDLIQGALEAKALKNGDSGDLEAICSVVSVAKGISDEELMGYTYYRLIYDFTTINRIEGNRFSFLLRSQGCEQAEITDLSSVIDLNVNPYDNLLQKQDHSLGDKLNKR